MTNLYGTKPNQVPTNNDLGTMAFLDMEGADKIYVKKATVTTLKTDPDKLLQNTNNTRLISNGNLIPDQVPLNSELGSLAFQNADSVKITGGTISSSTFTTATLVDAFQNTNRTTVTPSLYLNFANNEVLDPRISFTRASTATYVGSDGRIKVASANIPRFDHNPITGEGFGLLIEEARTNLLTYSAQQSDASWSKGALTVSTVNVVVAPDSTNANSIIESASGPSTHGLTQTTSASLSSGQIVTYSAYFKAGARNLLQFRIIANGAFTSTRLFVADLSNGSVGSTQGTLIAYSATPVGSGWYRLSLTVAADQAGVCTAGAYLAIPVNGNTYTGDGVSGMYMWGAQLEVGSTATSYIPTTTATVIRAADFVEMGLANWYTEVGGTFLLDFKIDRLIGPDGNRIFDINAGTSTSRLSVYHNTAGGITVFSNNGGTTTSSANNTNFLLGINKYAFTVKDNYVRHSLNGGTVGGIGSVNLYDGMTRIQFGNYTTGTVQLNGYIRSVKYYPTILSDAELVEMTA